MSKTPSTRLFDLVKALSPSEKRYFKVFTPDDPTNKYHRLFDAIDAQEVFDELALQQQVYGAEPPRSQKYSELKGYLYQLILRSLQAFDEKQGVDNQLKGLLLSVRALFRRSLYDDCLYALDKALRLARQHEKFETILEILEWKGRIAYTRADIDYLDQRARMLAREESACLAQTTNYKAYQHLFQEVWVLVRKNALRPNAQRLRLEQLAAHELLQTPETALSHRAKVLYHRVRAVLSYTLNRYEDFYYYSAHTIELMESRPELLIDDVSEYISALSNYVVSCGQLGHYQKVREGLAKLYRVTPITLDDQLKIYRQYYAIYFRLCIESGAFDEGMALLEQHLRELDKLDKNLFERSSFYFQYCYIYFGAGKFDESLAYLNQWLALPRTVERQELQSLARVLNLVIHYEMGNYLLLDSLLRSTYRFLRKKSRLPRFEQRLLYYLRLLNREHSRRGRRRVFGELLAELNTWELEKGERAMLQLFDFEAWLRSKVEDRPFAEIVAEKFDRKAAQEN